MTTARVALALTLLLGGYCTAAPLGPAALPPPAIIGSAPAFAGYRVDNVVDGNLATDYASQGKGVDTYIDFDFGSPTAMGQVIVTDRTTSGGGNGAFVGGQFDKVTGFDLIFSNEPTFSAPITTLHVPSPYVNRPPASNGPEDFQTTVAVPDVTARYVRFDVTAAAGANPGAAEFQFFTVPEPSAGVTLLLGSALGMRRTRRRT